MVVPSAPQPNRVGRRSGVSPTTWGVPPSDGTTHTRLSPPQVGGLSLRRNAITAPSGEYFGAVSAAPEFASGRTLPVATSTREMSAVGQSLVPGDFAWLNAMVRPAGCQSNPSAATLRSAGDSTVAGR